MARKGTVQTVTRTLLFISFLGLSYIFMSAIFGTAFTESNNMSPFFTFITISAIYGLLLVIMNPIVGKFSYVETKKPLVLLLVLICATSILSRFLIISHTDLSYLSFQTISFLSCGVLGSLIIFCIARNIWTDKEGYIAAVFYAIWPSHIFLGNINIAYAAAEIMFLFTILFILRSLKHDSVLYMVATSITAGVSFFCGSILNNTYLFNILSIVVFYLLYCVCNRKKKRHVLPISFFATFISLLLVSIISDIFLKTDLINQIAFRGISADSIKGFLNDSGDIVQNFWSGEIYIKNTLISYFSQLFYVFILMASVAGMSNILKRVKTEMLLFSLYPLTVTLVYLFIPFDNTTHLSVMPAIFLISSFGLTGAYSYIPLPLKERFTGDYTDHSDTVELDESYIIPGRWGHIKLIEDNNETEDIITEVIEKTEETIYNVEEHDESTVNEFDNISFKDNNLFAQDGSIAVSAKKAALKKAYLSKHVKLTQEVKKKETNTIDEMVEQLYENKNSK